MQCCSCRWSTSTEKSTSGRGFNSWQPRVRWLPQSQILLWAIREGSPRALQTSECHELLNPTRTSCLILAQRQPGKLASGRIYIRSPQCCVVKQNLFLFYSEVSLMVKLHARRSKRNPPLANPPMGRESISSHIHDLRTIYPQEEVVGSTNSAIVQNRANTASNTESKLSLAPTPEKNWMTLVVLYIENISVVILIRTDTTLDHSQKAEKVWLKHRRASAAPSECVRPNVSMAYACHAPPQPVRISEPAGGCNRSSVQ